MIDPHELRTFARRCRDMAGTSMDPDVIGQLRIWSRELADLADEIERDLDNVIEATELLEMKRRRFG